MIEHRCPVGEGCVRNPGICRMIDMGDRRYVRVAFEWSGIPVPPELAEADPRPPCPEPARVASGPLDPRIPRWVRCRNRTRAGCGCASKSRCEWLGRDVELAECLACLSLPSPGPHFGG